MSPVGSAQHDIPELASLLMLADSRLPTGAHANGGGAEWASMHDDLADPEVLEVWIEARLATTGRVEAAFAVAAGARPDLLGQLDAELTARLTGPRAIEVSRQMGRQLLRLAHRVWPDPAFDALAREGGPHLALAFGTVCRVLSIGPIPTATLTLHHLVASVATASVRMLAADPIELAAVQARCGRRITEIAAGAERWATCAIADLPARSMPLAEVLAEDHGRWPSRLFVA